MSTQPDRGRFAVTRRAIVDIVRASVLGSYGVAGFGSRRPIDRLRRFIGLGEPGIRVDWRDGLRVDLDLRVARDLPVAEVARQVESAVRYALRRSLAREPAAVTIHVRGLASPSGGARAAIDAGDGADRADRAEGHDDAASVRGEAR